jgi:hypothetical protein
MLCLPGACKLSAEVVFLFRNGYPMTALTEVNRRAHTGRTAACYQDLQGVRCRFQGGLSDRRIEIASQRFTIF